MDAILHRLHSNISAQSVIYPQVVLHVHVHLHSSLISPPLTPSLRAFERITMNGNAQASTSARSSEDPLACSVCNLPYRAHDKLRILTSTACGHSYHTTCAKPHYPERDDIDEMDYNYVHLFNGNCLHRRCFLSQREPKAKATDPLELEGHATFARQNARHAAAESPREPYSTIIRNMALERVVAHLAAKEAHVGGLEAGQRQDPPSLAPAPARDSRTSTVGARDMTTNPSRRSGSARTGTGSPSVDGKQRALAPPAASQATRDPSAMSVPSRPAKRVKLANRGSHAPLGALDEAEEAHDAVAADAVLDAEETGYISPSSSPLPDSDPEDESRTLAQLYQASQAVALAPPEGMEGVFGENGSEEGDEGEDEMLVEEEEEEDEVPLDKYGMPPLSQWRRSMAV